MLPKLVSTLVLSLSLLAPASLSQDCSTLDAGFDGSIASGGTLAIDVAGSLEDAILFLVVGPELGETCFSTGMSPLCLGVAFPALVIPVGQTDAAGDLSLAIDLPAYPDQVIDGQPLHFQALAVRVDGDLSTGMPSLQTCTSNVVTVLFE